MKRLIGSLFLAGVLACTALTLQTSSPADAASNITVTVNGCNAEVKWKPSHFAVGQRLFLTRSMDGEHYRKADKVTLTATTSSYTFHSLQPGFYHLRIISASSTDYDWTSDLAPAFSITCNPAFPY